MVPWTGTRFHGDRRLQIRDGILMDQVSPFLVEVYMYINNESGTCHTSNILSDLIITHIHTHKTILYSLYNIELPNMSAQLSGSEKPQEDIVDFPDPDEGLTPEEKAQHVRSIYSHHQLR